jgi:hypothetical protein
MKPISSISPEKQAALEADPDVTILTHSKTGDQIAVRAPSKSQWRRFRSAAMSEVQEKKEMAEELLVLDCLVFPERDDLLALIEKRPGCVITFAAGVVELAGFGGTAEKKD